MDKKIQSRIKEPKNREAIFLVIDKSNGLDPSSSKILFLFSPVVSIRNPLWVACPCLNFEDMKICSPLDLL